MKKKGIPASTALLGSMTSASRVTIVPSLRDHGVGEDGRKNAGFVVRGEQADDLGLCGECGRAPGEPHVLGCAYGRLGQ